MMAGDKITCSESTVHLGISRNVKDKVNVEEKVSIGRKTAYSLMEAGFHSVNGLKTCLNGFIWNTFVVPRLIYGLEIMTLKKGEIDCLEKFQRKSSVKSKVSLIKPQIVSLWRCWVFYRLSQ